MQINFPGGYENFIHLLTIKNLLSKQASNVHIVGNKATTQKMRLSHMCVCEYNN